MNSSKRNFFRPTLERLETREVPAAFGFGGMADSLLSNLGPNNQMGAALFAQVAPQAASLNDRIIKFCNSHLGSKVGGGECAHLAQEALRVAGANFVPQDPHHNGDYVWGKLLTTISHGRDSSSVRCQPGDIIQFQNVKLSNGKSYDHHTAIVAKVDSFGRPTKVYEQNVGAKGKGKGSSTYDRHDRLDLMTINKNTIVSGTVHIYRATPRQDAANKMQYSVVNDTKKTQTVTIFFNGKPQVSMSLDSFNKEKSYRTGWVSGKGTWTISVGGSASIALRNAAGYEVFTTASGRTAIRQI